MENYYQVLGVPPNASQKQIKERFRFLAQAYHPDKFATLTHKNWAEEAFKKINDAYQILSDPLRRAEYDRRQFSSASNYEERRRKEEAESARRCAEAEQRKQKEAEAEQNRAKAEQQRREQAEAFRRAEAEQRKREDAEAAQHQAGNKQQPICSYLVCPKCKEDSPHNSRYCVKCGQSLFAEAEQQRREQAEALHQAEAEQRKRKKADTAQHRVGDKHQPIFLYLVCPKCKADNPHNSRHCVKCGQSLNQTA